jgi:hypothetical protein
MPARATGALKVKLKQLEDLVDKYSSELQRRGSLRADLVEQFDGRLSKLVIDHTAELDKFYRVLRESAAECECQHAAALAELQSRLSSAAQNTHDVLVASAKKMLKICSVFRSQIVCMSQKLAQQSAQFDTDTSVLFDSLRLIAVSPRLPITYEISSWAVALASLQRQIGFLRRQRLEADHAFEVDLLRTKLQSLQLHQSFDVVRSTQCCVVELELCRSCLFRMDGLRKVTSEVSDSLAIFQRRRFDIAEDRIEYERIWNSVLWTEIDAIQNLQMDVDVTLYFHYRAKLGRLSEELRPESRSSADSREITKLRQAIAFLQKQIPRDRIGFQAEYQARKSEYVVEQQRLERAHREELRKLCDQRDGLLGMYNERIEVLMRNTNPPSALRERHLETVLRELSTQLGSLKYSRRSRSFSD